MKRTAMKKSITTLVAALGLAGLVLPVQANEREQLETLRQTTLNLIDLLVQQGVLNKDKADTLVKQAEAAAAESAKKRVANGDNKVVRVPYVPESVKQEIRDEIKQEVLAQAKGERWGDPGTLPDWVSRISVSGDVRLRMQRDLFSERNATPANVRAWYGIPANDFTNSREDRDRLRVRARLGISAKLSDSVSGAIRLATGSSTTDPVSTNQTLGNTGNKYSFVVDQAYLKLDPWHWLTASGGRIPNPWFATDLVWDPDLAFEGGAAKATYRFDDQRSVFLTAGGFVIQDVAPNANTQNKAKDKWLLGLQAGVDLKSMSGSRARFGVALYDYKNVEGIPNTVAAPDAYDATAPQFRQKGNSVFVDPIDTGVYKLAPKFRELAVTGQLDFAYMDPIRLILTGEYVRNIGFDAGEIRQRIGGATFIGNYNPQDKGYQVSAQVGIPKIDKAHDWNAYVGYKYLQADAVLDAFTDSDFHLGGTDAKGYFLGGNYGLDKNTWLSFKYMSADAIDGPPGGLAIDVMQVDLNARF